MGNCLTVAIKFKSLLFGYYTFYNKCVLHTKCDLRTYFSYNIFIFNEQYMTILLYKIQSYSDACNLPLNFTVHELACN